MKLRLRGNDTVFLQEQIVIGSHAGSHPEEPMLLLNLIILINKFR